MTPKEKEQRGQDKKTYRSISNHKKREIKQKILGNTLFSKDGICSLIWSSFRTSQNDAGDRILPDARPKEKGNLARSMQIPRPNL